MEKELKGPADTCFGTDVTEADGGGAGHQQEMSQRHLDACFLKAYRRSTRLRPPFLPATKDGVGPSARSIWSMYSGKPSIKLAAEKRSPGINSVLNESTTRKYPPLDA